MTWASVGADGIRENKLTCPASAEQHLVQFQGINLEAFDIFQEKSFLKQNTFSQKSRLSRDTLHLRPINLANLPLCFEAFLALIVNAQKDKRLIVA
jgi:hypothetical protein